ncbi:Contactin-associated protein-like 5 [Acropora cervicornis]|uniref:Contactin-associated protein-like 5 n=1 Tax=Acropora cervicornis TaxID=6130 RepID=A0AAD9V0D6_ACRCE|nr:Contactin-associated protein-like 5 [Acropora cervicornis]
MAVIQLILGALFLGSVFLKEASADTTPATGMIFGSGNVTVVKGEDHKCKGFTFRAPFVSGEVKVQLTLASEKYTASVTWAENVTTTGFIGCVATTSAISSSGRLINFQWIAYEDVKSSDGFSTRRLIPLYTTGTKCIDQKYEKAYSTAPHVFVTAVHKHDPLNSNSENEHDAAIVWAEDVTTQDFRACVRELKNFDGIHKNVQVDILVLFSKPNTWNTPITADVYFPNTNTPTRTEGYSYCQTVKFDQEFYSPPAMITTAEHYKDNVAATIDADNNAIQEWVRNVTSTGFEVCLKDIQRYDARHDPVTVNYITAGYYHPCNNVNCPYYGVCQAAGPTTHSCICVPCSTNESEPLCDNKGITHQSICKYKFKVCQDKEEPGIKHYGSCKPFVIQRGRVTLRLDTVDVKCRFVAFKSSFEVGRGTVNLQTSINYFNFTGSFVHDAAVAWVENVNLTSFEVCVLKAGRGDRLTPDSGLTFVDYVAFQEAPVNAVAGQQLMTDWWDGTNCQSITFSKPFDSSPHVLVTAEHSRPYLKHDAASTWVEDIKLNAFKVCLREMQNFDGQHKNILVNWFAYKDLPESLLSQQHKLAFPNNYKPRLQDHNAFCQILQFPETFLSAPTIIVSAAHTKTSLTMPPEYNSIVTWVEHINPINCSVCMKELNNLAAGHDADGYDPADVSMLVIGAPKHMCTGATALGVANQSIILDNQMTASSRLSTKTQASYGRLNGKRGNGWCAKTANNSHDWLQVDLGKMVHICSLFVQGEVSGSRWITVFQLRYSTDGNTWKPYMDTNGAQVEFYRINVKSSSTITTHKLPVPVSARYLRFVPIKQKNWNCARMEIYGMYASAVTR